MATAHSRTASPGDSIVIAAIALSVAFHALLLAVHFTDTDIFHFKQSDDKLEVVLTNSKSQSKPAKAAALAQHDTNGGGENEKGMVTSNLEASEVASEGDVLEKSQAAMAKLEAEQQRLLTQMKQTPISVDPSATTPNTGDQTSLDADSAESIAEKIRRLDAVIAKNINDYNERPRRGYLGPNTKGAVFATYYKDWQERIEKIGTLGYPAEAKGKMYGDVLLRVTLNPDGTIYGNEVTVMRSSGWPVLDKAAVSFVRKGVPYKPFPPEMRREYQVYEIINRFSFTKGDAFATKGAH